MPEKDAISKGKNPFPMDDTAIAARLAKRSATAIRTANSPDYIARVARDRYLEEPAFLEMAREAGVHLPVYGQKVTTGKMEKWLRKIGSPSAKYQEWAGEKGLTAFARNNPTWPLRSWAMLVLEAKLEGKL